MAFNLQSLTLSQLRLEARQADALVKAMAARPQSLRHLDLSWNNFTPGHLTKLIMALADSATLRSLSLAYNQVDANYDVLELT